MNDWEDIEGMSVEGMSVCVLPHARITVFGFDNGWDWWVTIPGAHLYHDRALGLFATREEAKAAVVEIISSLAGVVAEVA